MIALFTGQTSVKEHGTTNLHLDVADVVNVLVYVGVPKGNGNNHRAGNVFKATVCELFNESLLHVFSLSTYLT